MRGRGKRSSSPLAHALAWLTFLLLASSLLGVAPVLAEPGHPVGRANEGLSNGVAIPSWATHRRVHLLPSRSLLSARAASPLAGGLPRGDLQGATEPPYEESNISSTDRPVRYHEGGYGVQHDPHVHVIFWGGGWNEGAGPALRTELLGMYEGLSGSSLQGILTQYFDAAGRVSSTVTVESYTDTESPPPASVNDAMVRNEVAEALKAHPAWARELSSQFVVIPGPGATYEAGFARFCGYHGLIEEGSPSVAYTYAFVPDVAEGPFYTPCIGYDEHEDPNHVTSMIASHEYAESATDPGVDTWFTEEGFEVADMCASGDREVAEGPLTGSWVQGMWDEHRSACSIADAEPPHVYAVTEEGTTTTPREVGLSGQVGAEGLETHYHFEYGSTQSYGTSVPVPDGEVSAGSALVATVSATVKGLPEGVYHYRLVAMNSSGTTYGEDRTAISPGFDAQTLPQPPGSSEEHEAEGVSCAMPELCVAVGTYFNLDMEAHLTMAETWDGARWVVQPTPNPSEARKSENTLLGVSCASASACTAVGYDKLSGGGELSLAERWNGSGWSIEPTPNPPETIESELRSVACSSANECTAVGYYALTTGAWRTLAERWNGREWSVQPTPNMSGGADRLMGVSCPAATACVAVGFHSGPGGEAEEIPVAERWDGSEWALESIGPARSALYGVSCTSASACMAIGGTTPAGTTKALVERWDGSQWSAQDVDEAYDRLGGISGLEAVACPSASYCVAVGEYQNPASPMHAVEVLGLAWNGVGWTQLPIAGLPRPPGAGRDNWLKALSCPEVRTCVGVGDTLTGGFDEFAYQVGIAELEIGAPSVVTQAASGVTETAATLAGTVSPAGLETHYRFEYGPTTSYGSSTPMQAATVGAPVNATAALTGLAADATVHYRLVASNAAGTTYGADEVFTTSAAPPPPPNPGEVEGPGASTVPSDPGGSPGGPTTQPGPAPGGQVGGVKAYATISAVTSVHGDATLTRLSCRGTASAFCIVTLTITAEEKLDRGRLMAESAAVAQPVRATGLVRRTVILARKTVRLAAGASETLRVTLNAAGRRLLREVRGGVLVAKLAVTEHGAALLSRVVHFWVPTKRHTRR